MLGIQNDEIFFAEVVAELTRSPPSADRFRTHVGFDNLPVGDVSKHNTSALTLNVRHEGYRPTRRSRTFMVGLDEHAHSGFALVWLLTNMVDDGDEVVCVRVVENLIRTGEKYREDADKLLLSIQNKNELNRAISIVLEYSVGKLHATFQHFIQMHQPSMLIVGTKGRSLGGLQSLVNTRSSFSKYCLQYSPVPVVVVRPDEKRKKKKEKRILDPTRQNYATMLAHNDGKHEADSEASSVYELERGLSPDEEAHQVAAAIGLPAAFDPTIKPYEHRPANPRQYDQSPLASPPLAASEIESPTSPRHPRTATESCDDESGDEEEDEYEIEAVSAEQLHTETGQREDDVENEKKKKRLHAMEVGEAAALLKSGASVVRDEDEHEDESRVSRAGRRRG